MRRHAAWPGGSSSSSRRLYFFLPLFATFVFSLGKPVRSGRAATSLELLRHRPRQSGVLREPQLLLRRRHHHDHRQHRAPDADRVLGPAAGATRLRPFVEFITLLPFVIPPIILVFGLIRAFSHGAAAADPHRPRQQRPARRGLHGPVVPVHVPGGRHGPPGDRHPEPDRGGPEPGRRLDPDPRRVILPNLRVALLSGAFLTLAIVIGEFTIADVPGPAGVRPVPARSSAGTRPTSPPRSRSSASA